VTDESKQSGVVDPDLDSGWDLNDEDDESGAQANARPTLAPSFDLETYAREAMVPGSQAGQDSAVPAPQPSQPVIPRPSIVPKIDTSLSARRASLPPPPPLAKKPLTLGAIAKPPRPAPSAPRLPTPMAVASVNLPPPPPTPFPESERAESAPPQALPVESTAARMAAPLVPHLPPPAPSEDDLFDEFLVDRSPAAPAAPAPRAEAPAELFLETLSGTGVHVEPSARAVSHASSTRPPPPAAVELDAYSAILTPPPPSSAPPSQRITPREMQRIEAALIHAREEQARNQAAAEGAATAPRDDNLLALANLRAPILTPPRVSAVALPTTESLGPVSSRREGAAAAVTDPVVEMQERFALGDYSGALVMAESMLDENPTHVEAREYAESCRSVLQQMYTARIGPLDRVPVVDVARDQLRWLSIDHRTGFILSLVDGISSLEMILDVCGMPPLDALRMLFELVQQKIISVRDD